jgi:ketosteroid isomerase-like protein
MNDRAEKIRLLFAEYEKAFSSLDMARVADFYADSFISASPNGRRVVQNDEAFRSGLEKGAEFDRGIGMNSGQILSLTRDDITDQYSLVKVPLGLQVREDGRQAGRVRRVLPGRG